MVRQVCKLCLFHQQFHLRSISTQTFNTRQGRIRISLDRPELIGVYQGRGERPYQEDSFLIDSLNLNGTEISKALREGKGVKGKDKLQSINHDDHIGKNDEEQALVVGVFDGHNGNSVSSYLKQNLSDKIVNVKRNQVDDIVERYRALGGYLRRYKGGILADLLSNNSNNSKGKRRKEEEESKEDNNWNLHQRIHTAFLDADLDIISKDQEAGSVATLALLHSLDEPRVPFFSSCLLHLMIAHLGDTRALLCTVPEGNAVPLTETHHPEARSETSRLMRTHVGSVTDSFGESRWAGSLANTRGFGDYHYKQLGVFAEPAITSHILHGTQYSFLTLLSDGITDTISDQEICDLITFESKGRTPYDAARKVVEYVEGIGAGDNCTALVVPLQGWGGVKGEDKTKERRRWRVENYEGREERSRRM